MPFPIIGDVATFKGITTRTLNITPFRDGARKSSAMTIQRPMSLRQGQSQLLCDSVVGLGIVSVAAREHKSPATKTWRIFRIILFHPTDELFCY